MKVGMLLRRIDLNDGVASHLDTLISQLHLMGHEIYLFSGRVSFPPGWEHREASLRRHTVVWEQGEFHSIPQYILWLRSMLQRYPVDVLHVHGMKVVLVTRLAVLWRLPIVATAHPSRTSTPDPSPAKLRILWATRFLYRALLPDRAIAVSTEMAEWFERIMQVPRFRIRLICHGSDTAVFYPPSPEERIEARRTLGVSMNTLVCVMVGRFDQGKRHETAVKALSRLAEEGRDVALVIAGSGDPLEHVASLRKAADPNSYLTIKCQHDVENIRPIYAAGDLIIHPSEREAFALVIAEAMLSGLIPLRTPTGGARDQIEVGVNGFLFPIGDHEKLAEHLRWLLDHSAERIAMSKRAVKTALEKFTADVMAEKIINVYREVVHHAPADQRTIIMPSSQCTSALKAAMA